MRQNSPLPIVEMPKPCLCQYVPEILERLEALEKQAGQCDDAEECGDLTAREKELDEFEKTLIASEDANETKLKELQKVSEQIRKLKEQMAELKQDEAPEMTEQQRQQYDVNQKALETYSNTWTLTNQIFVKMYNQLKPIFQLPELKEGNTAMFEGIQKLGAGLLAMAQLVEKMKEEKAQPSK